MNMRTDLQPTNGRASGLVDVLDRVLDKGLVVAGDIKVSLAEVELLTIRIRLIVCSIDKAEQIGLDCGATTHLAPGRDRLAVENAALKKQIRSPNGASLRWPAGQAGGPDGPSETVDVRGDQRCPLNALPAAQVSSTFSIASSTRESSSTRGCACPSSVST
jgi:hypothetical protein